MEYLSPGVYVEEVPSAVQPIAGVGTSTAGFIGVVPDSLIIPQRRITGETKRGEGGTATTFDLAAYPVLDTAGAFVFRVGGAPVGATLANIDAEEVARVTFNQAPPAGELITGEYVVVSRFTVEVAPEEVKLCTTFGDFKKFFGDFSTNADHQRLAHAVYGFFNNGGTRCYVMRVHAEAEITEDLLKSTFESVDEIAIVAAPGIIRPSVRSALDTHCKLTGDRFAIFDSAATVTDSNSDLDLTLLAPSNANNVLPDNSDYAAFYFPWIQVFDPVAMLVDPPSQGLIYVPPSGHVAGIYARVDTARGVHKAPANETVRGALGLRYNISKSQQDGLNPQGVNVIRDLNGNIRVWGARTIGGDANGEWRYISVRRLFLFLRESIDEGTQWVVFEPNTPNLWAKITRNVTAFLTNVWRAGALFGTTPQEAFYVKCDAETNPPEERDAGKVVTEIGVAVVKPAEFVIFRISQWAGPGN
jgi:phage tail sheath protein FI